jgi:hypothetical protein
MRLLIYLLAMLTGFSAAEAARPVSAVPASVDAAAGVSVAIAIVDTVVQVGGEQDFAVPALALPVNTAATAPAFAIIQADTPVIRRDVLLD